MCAIVCTHRVKTPMVSMVSLKFESASRRFQQGEKLGPSPNILKHHFTLMLKLGNTTRYRSLLWEDN